MYKGDCEGKLFVCDFEKFTKMELAGNIREMSGIT